MVLKHTQLYKTAGELPQVLSSVPHALDPGPTGVLSPLLGSENHFPLERIQPSTYNMLIFQVVTGIYFCQQTHSSANLQNPQL
ncbi:unnamed protein product [Pleuronectes platessa]|uniref:Uncharacterized protein n=1 Tax=Pleuronectes platessa TaxID=8262 RepID=A0A9N7UIJ4_PLEPL|nr:unnamed protein product [Pleuronectes platessa]